MTINEIRAKYSNEELFSDNVDFEFRKEIFTALFDSLYENKIVFHERLTCVATIKKVELLPESFSLFIEPHSLIPTGTPSDTRYEGIFERLKKGFEIGGSWSLFRFHGNCLYSSPYNSWIIWLDPEFVKEIDKLVANKKFKKARSLTMDRI